MKETVKEWLEWLEENQSAGCPRRQGGVSEEEVMITSSSAQKFTV